MKLLRKVWAWFRGLFGTENKPPPVKVVDLHPWNSPKRRTGRWYRWSDRLPTPQPRMSKRERCRRWRWLKRHTGFTRRVMGAIGAGHMRPPDDYWSAKAYLGL